MATNYPQQTLTTFLGLSLVGMDEVIAEDFIIIDNAFGSGGLGVTLQTNGINNPVQNILNIIGGTSISATADAFGGVTLSYTGAGGGTITVNGDGTVLATPGPTISLGGSGALTLVPQVKNTFLAGPVSGANASPTFRTIGAGDIPSGTVTWDAIGNALGNLSLSNAAFSTTFGQTSAVTWKWVNTTGAVAGTNQSSPILMLGGQYFTLGATAEDDWSIQNSVGTSLSSPISNIVENASSVVTLTTSGNTIPNGTIITLVGLTIGTWLNGLNVTLTTSNATNLIFTDPTSHGTQASHAETGTATQTNPTASLVISHTGTLGAPQIVAPLGTAATPVYTFAGNLTTGMGNTSNTLQIGTGSGNIQFLRGGILGATLALQVSAGVACSLQSNTSNTGFTINGDIANGTTIPNVQLGIASTFLTATSGVQAGVLSALGFGPTSGTAQYWANMFQPSINQTGGANGNVRVVASYPVLTVAGGTVYLFAGGTSSAAGQAATLTDKFLVDSAGNITVFGNIASSSAGALSTSALSLTGAPITGGSGTTTFPLFYLNGGSAPSTWSTNGTVIGINSPSGFTGNAIDVHVNGGVSVFSVAGSGASAISGTLGLGNIINKYRGVSTVSGGVPAEFATSDLTAQSAAITATTLLATSTIPGSGMYRISWSATITTAASGSSSLGGTNGFQVTYTSPTDSVIKTTVAGLSTVSAANTTGTAIGDSLIVYAAASTNIQYQFDYASVGATAMVYELHIKCEAL